MSVLELQESDIWHYCEYCFNPCVVFCGCKKEKEEMEKLKTKNN